MALISRQYYYSCVIYLRDTGVSAAKNKVGNVARIALPTWNLGPDPTVNRSRTAQQQNNIAASVTKLL